MAAARNDIQVVACGEGDQRLLAEYSELDDDFYGLNIQDLETVSDASTASAEDPDEEDTGAVTEFDISTAIPRANCGESSDSSLLMPVDDKLAVQAMIERGCGCPHDCYKQFSEEEVCTIRLKMLELEKVERDMLILGKLMVCARLAGSISHARKVCSTKRQRITYEYSYDCRVVCKSLFCFLHVIGEKVLKNLQSHLKENGPTPRVHGNKGRLPSHAFSFETTKNIVDFILNYARIFGLPQPAAGRGRAEVAPIYLSASEGYHVVHQKYVEACISTGEQAAKYHAFVSTWHKILPHIKFMTPRTDVCHYCDSYRVQISSAVTESEKIRVSTEFKEHVIAAQEERNFYLGSIKKAQEQLQLASPEYGHYTFNFAQMLQLPYHARQVGPLYFKVPLKAQLFGICKDSTNTQINYLFDESQSIGVNGSNAHGPNSVVSMLHHFFENHSGHEPECHLHADNCVGKNKNRTVVGYLSWRVATGLNTKITLSFMLVGHTRCFVDGNFGLLKKFYRRSDVDTMQQLRDVVNNSSRTNNAQMYSWEWREWDKALDTLFKPIPGIRKLQHFTFSSSQKGQVTVKDKCNGEGKTVNILKQGITVEQVERARLPKIIQPAGMTNERKKYLYQKIREHVWPEFQDITCPPP